jgi:hypothetical protein
MRHERPGEIIRPLGWLSQLSAAVLKIDWRPVGIARV